MKVLDAIYNVIDGSSVNEALDLLIESKMLPKKGAKPYFSIQGQDSGNWVLIKGYDIGWHNKYDWNISAAMSSKNKWRTLSVDGATEQHSGLLKALKAIVTEYPELSEYWIMFDGPYIPVDKLITVSTPTRDWGKITFYHGTASAYWESIKQQGLKPRSETKSSASYGSMVGAKQGRLDAVYLTTQKTMAKFAARDAAIKTGSQPLLLSIRGIDGSMVAPDEDSKETDPRKSMDRIGSIAYIGDIPPRLIRRVTP